MVSERLTSAEWRIVAAVIGVVLLLTSLPYWYGYITAPTDRQFMGIILDVPDTAQYFSWMEESKKSILITNRLTPESNPAIFFNLLWFGLGRVETLTGLDHGAVYQAFRLFAGGFSLAVVYLFCSFLFEIKIRRIVAFLLITFGSGFGWLLVVQKQFTGRLSFPLDLYIAEPNTFLSLLGYPHLIFSAALIVLIFVFTLVGWERGRTRFVLFAGLVSLVLGLEHAYDLIIVYVVLAAMIGLLALRNGFHWHLLRDLAIIVGISSPPALYSFYITQATPTWRGVLEQYGNAGVYTPNPFHLIILLGLPFLLALLSFSGLVSLKQTSQREILVKAWFMSGFFLIYLPTDYQVKMLTGWQIPIGILATNGIFRYALPLWGKLVKGLSRGPRKTQRTILPKKLDHWIMIALFLAVLPTNVYLFAWRFVELEHHEYPYYLHIDEIAALRWMREHALPSDVVLSSLMIGQYIPSVGGNRAYLAHWAQTLRFFEKRELVNRFFTANTLESERLNILGAHNVRYVFDGEAEGVLGSYNPSNSAYLTEVFAKGKVRILEVHKE